MTSGPGSSGAQLSPRMIYTLICLMLAYVLAFVDRTIFSLMLDPIRKEFLLNDTEVSLLAGLAFALFYAILGLPMGRIADNSSRRRLIVIGMVAWSIATALCGAARSVFQLFAARAAVGVGEATLTPASYSLIGDLVPRERLGTAMSIYAIGATLGGGLAMIVGGAVVQWAMSAPPVNLPLIGDISGWRAAFFVVGVPGVLLALLIGLTIPEPPRKAASSAPKATFSDLAAHLKQHPFAFTAVLLGYSLVAVTIYSFLIWGPAYLFRIHKFSPIDVGLALGIILGVGGSIGSIIGGFVSDYLAERGRAAAPVIVIIATQIASFPFLIAGFLAGDATMAVILMGVGMFILSAFGGLQHSTIQAMTPSRLRGQMAAVYLICTSLIGSGLGPVLVGLLSDANAGPEAVGRSMAIMAPLVAIPAAVLLWVGLGAIRRAMADTRLKEPA